MKFICFYRMHRENKHTFNTETMRMEFLFDVSTKFQHGMENCKEKTLELGNKYISKLYLLISFHPENCGNENWVCLLTNFFFHFQFFLLINFFDN